MSEETLPIEHSELMGITGLFGALTRTELRQAVSLLCEYREQQPNEAVVDRAIDQALTSCRLLVAPMAVEPPLDDAPLVVGPNASPTVPSESGWLFEQLDIHPREVDEETICQAADTEVDRAIERARAGNTGVEVDELVAVRERLSDWEPEIIEPEAAIADTLPVDSDELAGIVEPFGALTRLELRQALSVLCYRRTLEAADAALDCAIDRALTSRQLLVAPGAVDEPLGDAPIVVGPMATPAFPEAFDDLSGVLGIDPRPIDVEAVREAAYTDLKRSETESDSRGATPPESASLEAAIENWELHTLERSTLDETQTEAVSERSEHDAGESSAESGSPTVPEIDGAEKTLVEQHLLALPPENPQSEIPLNEDELAGIVDLFGALTRPELRRASSELCYRRGVDLDEDPLDALIDQALSSFVLLAAPGVTAPPLEKTPLVAGPAAFPAHPEHAEDLPHILDVDSRAVDRATARDAARNQLQAAIDIAMESDEPTDPGRLLELCYDLETWGAVSLDEERDQLERQLEQ